MKTLKNLLTAVIIILTTSIVYGQGVSISENLVEADASAILDVSSTTQGMLVPRMTEAERIAIVSPASGLLVYDTNSKSFWYFDTSWNELEKSNISVLQDSDGNTKIEVEKTENEDIIRLTTAGNERMKIDADGNIYMGNTNDYTKIGNDGTLTLNNEATVFEDLCVPVTSTKKGDSKMPGFDKYTDDGSSSQGLYTFQFDKDNEEELYFTVQMPHSWKVGSEIFPHIHWIAPTDLGTTNVEWGLEYTWSSVGQTFGSSTIITSNTPIDYCLPVTADKHVITDLPSISGAGQEISSMLICRVFRKAGSDTYPNDAFMLEIDFHYERDALGSRSEYVK